MKPVNGCVILNKEFNGGSEKTCLPLLYLEKCGNLVIKLTYRSLESEMGQSIINSMTIISKIDLQKKKLTITFSKCLSLTPNSTEKTY